MRIRGREVNIKRALKAAAIFWLVISIWVGLVVFGPPVLNDLTGDWVSTEPQPEPTVDAQALAWCDGHDGDLVMLEPDGEPEPYCVLPSGDAVRLMDRVEVAG